MTTKVTSNTWDTAKNRLNLTHEAAHAVEAIGLDAVADVKFTSHRSPAGDVTRTLTIHYVAVDDYSTQVRETRDSTKIGFAHYRSDLMSNLG